MYSETLQVMELVAYETANRQFISFLKFSGLQYLNLKLIYSGISGLELSMETYGVQRHFSFPMKTQIFFFSVVRMVQGEAKTPKIMGCCRANFAVLPALKIGTFGGQ